MQNDNYLREVRDQYENYPYPPRDAEDELKRLLPTRMDSLAQINHYGFGGNHDFNGFRALVAGGGTGDCTIYLAEQLRGHGGEVVHLDISARSIKVAQARAEQRGLTNIEWVNRSLLDLPSLGLGHFDYINCCGVLHHLESPDEGMARLSEVLKDSGLLSVMVYATVGRAPVYQMQELMRYLNRGEPDMQVRVDNTKAVLRSMPSVHLLKLVERFDNYDYAEQNDDIDIYDTFLHSQDRSYTVPELYDFVGNAGLRLVQFAGGSRSMYEPETYIQDRELLELMQGMNPPVRQAVSELMLGRITTHIFYACKSDPDVADVSDTGNVPFFHHLPISPGEIIRKLEDSGSEGFAMPGFNVIDQVIRPEKWMYAPSFLAHINGNSSIQEILDIVRHKHGAEAPSVDELMSDFSSLYAAFNTGDWLLLRQRSVPPFKSPEELQGRLNISRFAWPEGC